MNEEIEYEARAIADGADFSDFDKQHPTPCYYVKTEETLDSKQEEILEKIFLGKELEADESLTKYGRNFPVEHRGITLSQLWSIMENVTRRCILEKWTNYEGTLLTPETVTLYDVKKYIIMPYTVQTKKSFVESLPSTAGPQPPRWFVSHYWGEPIKSFILCIEKFVENFSANSEEDHEERGGGMTEHTPIWVCAYANNQWDLDDDITVDPSKSGFTRAIQVARNRTISILDDKGIVFTRIWCIYELYRTLIANRQNVKNNNTHWVLYTTLHDGKEGVGLVCDTRTKKQDEGDYHEVYAYQNFPFELIKKSLNIQIENADATVELDRYCILNAITGEEENFDKNPPTTHEKYDELNSSLQGAIAGSIPILQAATTASDEDWKDIMTAFSKGTIQNEIDFHFPDAFRKGGTNPGGWSDLTPNQFVDLISHVPVNTSSLIIRNPEFGPLGCEVIQALVKCIKKCRNLTKLQLEYWYYGLGEEGDFEGESHTNDAAVHLTDAIASNGNIESLILHGTTLFGSKNVSNWVQAIGDNTKLKLLLISGVPMDPSDEDCANLRPAVSLTDEGCEELAKGIALNQSLERIFLSGLNMSKEGALAFGPALKQSKTITQMSIYSSLVDYKGDESNSNDEIAEAMKEIGQDLKDHVPRINVSTKAALISKELDLELCVIM